MGLVHGIQDLQEMPLWRDIWRPGRFWIPSASQRAPDSWRQVSQALDD